MSICTELESLASSIWRDQLPILRHFDYSPGDLDNVANVAPLGDYLRINYYTGLGGTAAVSFSLSEKKDYLRDFAKLKLGYERDLGWLDQLERDVWKDEWFTGWFYVNPTAVSGLAQRFYVNPQPKRVPAVIARLADWVRSRPAGVDAKVIGPDEAHRDDPLVIYVAAGLIEDTKQVVARLPASDLEDKVPPATKKLARGVSTAPEMGMSWGHFCGLMIASALWDTWSYELGLDEAKTEKLHQALPLNMASHYVAYLRRIADRFIEDHVDPCSLQRTSSTARDPIPPPKSTGTSAHEEGESGIVDPPTMHTPSPTRQNPHKLIVDIKRGLAKGEAKTSVPLQKQLRNQVDWMGPPSAASEREEEKKKPRFAFPFKRKRKKSESPATETPATETKVKPATQSREYDAVIEQLKKSL